MSEEFSIEAEVERARRSVMESLQEAARAPRTSSQSREINVETPPRGEIVQRQEPQLEKRHHQMTFNAQPMELPAISSPVPNDIQENGGFPGLPSPPGGTVVLGAVDGNIQWLETNEC